MVFWLGVLVFLAGIMTYMFFPRNDLYRLNMYQEEGNVVTFVNQHQAAKDLMYQLISWNSTDNTGIHPLPYDNMMDRMTPVVMNDDDIYADGEEKANLNPDPDNENAVGHYTSAIVCLGTCEEGTEGCVQGKNLTQCPSSNQYVITYGYMPEWWSKVTAKRQAWFRALLKRTHGSVGCGVLTHRENDLYSINNSQKLSGYEVIDTKRVVTPVITQQLVTEGLNTCEAGDDECNNGPNRLEDLMFCMTPFKNPYLGTPVFHWDKANNSGTGPIYDENTGNPLPLTGDPLIGELDNDAQVISDIPTTNYTLTGVVPQKKDSSANHDLISLNANVKLIQTCAEATCDIKVNDGTNDLISVTDIPETNGFSFIYTVSETSPKQTLTVYYNKREETDGVIKKVFTEEKATKGTTGPALSTTDRPDITPEAMTFPYVLDVRLYNGSPLTDREIVRNAKTDLKRFGL